MLSDTRNLALHSVLSTGEIRFSSELLAGLGDIA